MRFQQFCPDYKVTEKKLDKVVAKSTEDRQQRLKDGLPTGLRATPKDNSLNPTTVTTIFHLMESYQTSLNQILNINPTNVL